MSSIIGHTRHIGYFTHVIQRGKLSHAYLFHGSEHVGKFTFARHIAKVFHCNGSGSGSFENVCNACSECIMIDEGRHPYVILLDADHALVSEKETRKDISIDDVRELRRRFSFAGSKDAMRIVIVNDAHMMSKEAANAFLKLLEEPGAHTLFMLIAPEKEMLLQTIISRAHSVYFAPVPEQAIHEYLADKKISADMREEFLPLAAGRPGVILHMFADAEYRKQERGLAETMHSLLKKGDIPYALRIAEKAAFDALLLSRLRQALFYALRDELLTARSEQYAGIVRSIKAASSIFSTMDTTNANPRLALDALFLQILHR